MYQPKLDRTEEVPNFQNGTNVTTIASNGKKRHWKLELSDDTNKLLLHNTDKFSWGSSLLEIEIFDLNEIRTGFATDQFHRERENRKLTKKPEKDLRESCCFSLHHKNYKTVYNIVAQNAEEATMWVKRISSHIDTNRFDADDSSTFLLKRAFQRKDINNTKKLSLKECEKLLKEEFHMALDQTRRTTFISSLSKRGSCAEIVLDGDELLKLAGNLTHSNTLDAVFDGLARNGVVKHEQLLAFCRQTQGDDNIDVEKIMEDYGEKSTNKIQNEEPGITREGFQRLMASEMFDITKHEHRQSHQPMDQPLSHYFQKSSHNTCLLTNQLWGPSSIEGFIRAIRSNYTCLELDLWNGLNGEAIITHGKTLTTSILARDVLQSIQKVLQNKDHPPIVLSMDDHLSKTQRDTFINDLKGTFGEKLYVNDIENLRQLPTPDELRNKFIIKGPRSKYGNLANICQAVSFPQDALDDGAIPAPQQISSLSEHGVNKILKPTLREKLNSIVKAVENRAHRLIGHTKHQLVRIYPGWQRQLSSNYDPTPSLNAGCQMVAMNIQTKCRKLALYEGRFKVNGDNGYALKPQYLLDPTAPRPAPKKLTITIIGGSQFQHSCGFLPHHFHVKISINGEPSDRATVKTKKRNDASNVEWNETFTFNLSVPESATILLEVKMTSTITLRNTTVGSFAIPALSLGMGYRNLHLQDKLHEKCSPRSTLLVKISMKDTTDEGKT